MTSAAAFTKKILNKNAFKEKIKEQLFIVKEGLSRESDETKEMLKTYYRYSQGKSTLAEMTKANQQFQSFLKTLGLGTLAILPFAPVTIPALVKLGKKVGIDILPDSFKHFGE